eukprot:Pgem_evm1s17906
MIVLTIRLSLVSEIDKLVTEKTPTKTSLTGKSINTPLTTKNITSKSNDIKKRVANNLFPFLLLADDTNVRSATMFKSGFAEYMLEYLKEKHCPKAKHHSIEDFAPKQSSGTKRHKHNDDSVTNKRSKHVNENNMNINNNSNLLGDDGDDSESKDHDYEAFQMFVKF